eukprot:1141259-Pelagomonas_calceolata.AAC.3
MLKGCQWRLVNIIPKGLGLQLREPPSGMQPGGPAIEDTANQDSAIKGCSLQYGCMYHVSGPIERSTG